MVTFGFRTARSPLDELWGVQLYLPSSPVHAVKGRSSRVTCCGEHFSPDGFQQALPVTCERCLEQIGCLPVEV